MASLWAESLIILMTAPSQQQWKAGARF